MSFLRLRNVSIHFPIYQGGSRSLKKTVLASTSRGNLARDAAERIIVRALDSVDLDIESGDRLALIGPNGSGKSTMLRTLAGIYEPTSGDLYAEGRICSLLDSTVGMNPDATGQENIVLRGMYLGIHPASMAQYVDEIAEFTELGDYLEMPVRTYSAGMAIRLAFGISTCICPDILLMDEWLAAGDTHFLDKAQRRLESFVRESSLLVLASHSLPLLEKWCNHAVFLYQGRIVAQGTVKDVWQEYEETVAAGRAA
ncbi:ABC transporter ATP-binding protein [Telmatospirillum siberiense]|uniref:Sugar ABC transporter ATP-binding protein n=1 Tax=Telmatospirillum siberiense TaxID=382514 RepID=A0A2N3PYH4_9PROT|nr:ABC transporter ATP-binding protein [Telmatospirillum siberiense]PKU25411.1 sugar ABC transporter ATP-binding protein [Telmatospirillum siberiense]